MNFATETEKTFIHLLLTDLDVALTYLNVAATTRIRETARRNFENAQRVYDQVVGILQAVTLSDEQQALFDRKLSLLKSRLRASRPLLGTS
jgi:hypothetical protein